MADDKDFTNNQPASCTDLNNDGTQDDVNTTDVTASDSVTALTPGSVAANNKDSIMTNDKSSDLQNTLSASSSVTDRETKLNEREQLVQAKEDKAHELGIGLLDKIEDLAKSLIDNDQSLSAKIMAKQDAFDEHLSVKSDAQKSAFDEHVNNKLTSQKAEFDKSLSESTADALRRFTEQSDDKANKLRTTLENDLAKFNESANENGMNALRKAQERSNELDLREAALNEQEAKNSQELRRIERDKVLLDKRAEELDKQAMDVMQNMQNVLNSTLKDLQERVDEQSREITRQENKRQELQNQLERFIDFETKFGGTPEQITTRIADLEERNAKLYSELQTRPDSTVENDLNLKSVELQRKVQYIHDLENKQKELLEKSCNASESEKKASTLECEKNSLAALNQVLEKENSQLLEKLNRLLSTQGNRSTYEERVAEISGEVSDQNLHQGREEYYPSDMSEIEWLHGIESKCISMGLQFPKRILYAFHTAVKISDWSCITVLAGVSGTGKSELPKLYALFGGMNFISVPVQPNWDSQESMLGYFNSIDNRFEPEPLLRFLVNCTEKDPFNQEPCLVLLDEMNLAHVEHYFADFLSKLEIRRSCARVNLPTIEVKLGAGVKPYQLKLSRNILWTGTMNQDETTKSLSDKVLDRGIVINFPRPLTLKGRKNVPVINTSSYKNYKLLKMEKWNEWVQRKIDLEGDQQKKMDEFRSIVENINNNLEDVGRAIGHRVWQSIEFYIMNYPTVIAARAKLNKGETSSELLDAMNIAFEDQIVQKIMPKLRGVETRGQAKQSLDKIAAILSQNGLSSLNEDFNFALKHGYGQFMWASAKYIAKAEQDNTK
ncbi:hypothetical protein [Anaerobiospirillum succiniciproducens]|uniref:hypothetical protein n=1 Tax=Anaerobiospirillum succiniciproducens TaxID=13335 RepID=UPI00040787DC|nr:hypothetical protein [Anaerobiospirillum succiniciproducens]